MTERGTELRVLIYSRRGIIFLLSEPRLPSFRFKPFDTSLERLRQPTLPIQTIVINMVGPSGSTTLRTQHQGQQQFELQEQRIKALEDMFADGIRQLG